MADHDFTKLSFIPSVFFKVAIPDDISGSWYSGKVHISLKEGTFEPSSPIRHASELISLIETDVQSKPILFLYTDGGPDHRLTFIAVQLSLISLFLQLDLDYLCAARTAPYHSWRNPVEHIMSVINLGLQCVGLTWNGMDDDSEQLLGKAGNMKEIRAAAAKHPTLREAIIYSVAGPKICLPQVLSRLQLKQESFNVFNAATAEAMDQSLTVLKQIDDTIINTSINKKSLPDHPNLKEFMQHCCRKRHYFFEIRKCGSLECNICKSPRLSEEIFKQLNSLPDPTPGSDNHYLSFSQIFGQVTTEEHRPSLHVKTPKKTLPFSASVQHVKNVDMMMLCEECDMWRLLYCKTKLKKTQRTSLESLLDNYSYTCGSSLQDMELPEPFSEVYVCNINCYDPIEKLYYPAGYTPICIYCAEEVEVDVDSAFYPQCAHCQKPKIKK